MRQSAIKHKVEIEEHFPPMSIKKWDSRPTSSGLNGTWLQWTQEGS